MFVYRTSLGNQWLSKEDLEKLTVEKLSDHEVIQWINSIAIVYITNQLSYLISRNINYCNPFKYLQ